MYAMSQVTDARATMALFRLHRRTWEKNVRPLPQGSANPPPAVPHKRSRSTMMSESADDEDEDRDEQGGEDIPDASPAANRKGKKKKGKAEGAESFPGGGRRGVSSGLSTVVKRAGVAASSKMKIKTKTKTNTNTKEKWWKELGGGGSSGSKGSLRMKVG